MGNKVCSADKDAQNNLLNDYQTTKKLLRKESQSHQKHRAHHAPLPPFAKGTVTLEEV